MRTIVLVRLLAFCASVGFLTACSSTGITPALTPSALSSAGAFDGLYHGESWMDPDAQGQDLLYVSDIGTRDVKVYSYPGGQLKGTLTGFTEPWGVCADSSGNVFVTDLKGFRIFEFRHGAKKPAAILRDPGEEPGGCAVDPATGNLAVANVSTPYTGPGDLLVFLHARGKPKKYHDTAIHYYQFCGYDGNGNLFVDGVKLGKFQLAELLKGHSSLIDIALNKTYAFAGGIQWDGTSLAIGDYELNVIDRFQISGSNGKKIGETQLKGAKFPIGIWIQGSTVIAANDDGGNVMYWNYPSGGPHKKTIGGLHYPLSAAVSVTSR